MDRNSIIGIVLIVAILFGYTWYTMPSAEEQARQQRTQDSLASVELEKRAREAEAQLSATTTAATLDTTAATDTLSLEAVLESALADSVRNTMLAKRYGTFHPAAQGTDSEVVIENERLQVAIRTHGARPTVIRLKEYQTYRKTPLLLADPDSGTYEFRFFQGNLDISTRDLYFTAEKLGTDGVVLEGRHHRPRHLAADHLPIGQHGLLHAREHRARGQEANVDPRSTLLPLGPAGPAQREVPRDRTAEVRRVLQVLQRRPRLPERDRRGPVEAGGPHQLGGLQAGLLHRRPGQRRRLRRQRFGDGHCHPRRQHAHQAVHREALLREGARRQGGPAHPDVPRARIITAPCIARRSPSSTRSSTWAGASSAG